MWTQVLGKADSYLICTDSERLIAICPDTERQRQVRAMKDIRPKINEAELALILEAMETCGWDKLSEKDSSDPRYQLYHRFVELRKGSHVKKRIIGPFAFALDIRKLREKKSS